MLNKDFKNKRADPREFGNNNKKERKRKESKSPRKRR